MDDHSHIFNDSNTITVEVKALDCSLSVISSIAISDITYNVESNEAHIYHIPLWIQSIPLCPDITFELLTSSGDTFDPSIFSFNRTHFAINATDTSLNNTNLAMKLRGKVENYVFKDEPFKVIIVDNILWCNSAYLSKPSSLPTEITYQVSNPTLNL